MDLYKPPHGEANSAMTDPRDWKYVPAIAHAPEDEASAPEKSRNDADDQPTRPDAHVATDKGSDGAWRAHW